MRAFHVADSNMLVPKKSHAGPVPPLSDLLGTHQHSKNAKLGGLLRKIRMSVKFEIRGSILA